MSPYANIVRCLKCSDTIASEHRHDAKWCSCRSVMVDGGKVYIRRAWTPEASWVEIHEDGSESAPRCLLGAT